MEETIELRKLIEIFLKGKKIVLICSVVTMLSAGILDWFVLEEKYESVAVVQIAGGAEDNGIMSNYVAAEFTPIVYMQRMQNVEQNKKYFKENGVTDFDKDNLSIINNQNTNLVEISYNGTSPENAKNNLNLLIKKTKNEVEVSTKETLNQLRKTYLSESKDLSNEIEQLMSKYNQIIVENNLPEVLILQTIASSQFVLNLTDEQTNTLANITGKLQNDLLQLKAQIDTKSEEYRVALAKYQSVKTGLDSFSPEPFIRVIIDPTLPEKSSSPNLILILTIGLVLGLLVGTGWIFFCEYWRTSSKDNKNFNEF